MSKRKGAKKSASNVIALNKKARHDYFIEDSIEAGVVLEGWEVKSLRAGRVHIREGYVTLRDHEAWLTGCHITPLTSASTHVQPDPVRDRKLLLHRPEISRLVGAVERRGYTLVPTKLYWIRGRAKVEIGLARGKRKHDKRVAEKDRDWQRERERLLKHA